jgi:two-component system cell cycle sensor histidine kinase/response regulator CckA
LISALHSLLLGVVAGIPPAAMLCMPSTPPPSFGTYVYFEVSDTGEGINDDTMKRIFDPFYTTKFTGRGLGLSAVLGIVRGHDGALRVYSEPGKGTTFKVLFPACNSSEESASALAPIVGWKGEGTALLVDDEETIRAVSSAVLQRLGLKVITAKDGKEAVDLYLQYQSEIDIVLMDLTMPHMNGDEAFRKMRQANPEVRVILCSGYSEDDIASRFAGKGLSACLQKPYSMAKLCSLLSGLLPDK